MDAAEDEGYEQELVESGISTVHITGFPDNANDREVENFCRFLPGYVAAKASLSRTPKAWVRFDTQENAVNALEFLDNQPFDLLDPTVVLRASLAKTDFNVHERTRSGGARCMAGTLDQLMNARPPLTRGGSNGTHQPFAGGGSSWRSESPGSWKGEGPGSWKGEGSGAWKGDGPGVWRSESPGSWKGGGSAEAKPSTDTLVIMNLEEKGLAEEEVRGWLSEVEGFVAINVAPSRNGTNVFAKFKDAGLAKFAIQAAKDSGLDAQMARTSLDVSKMGGKGAGASWDDGRAPARAPAASVANASWGEDAPWAESRGGVKRPRTEEETEDTEGDTLVVTGIGVKGITHEQLEDFFQVQDGFVLSNFSPVGRGGGNYFVKFQSLEQATKAFDIATKAGFMPQVARNSLSIRKLEKWM